jgi:hypothetical protein
LKKEKKGGRKRESPRVSANKMGKSLFREEKNISTSKSFYVSPFSPLSSYHIQNPFPKLFEK